MGPLEWVLSLSVFHLKLEMDPAPTTLFWVWDNGHCPEIHYHLWLCSIVKNLLKLYRNFFALSMCLTKFLLNMIQTLCTDMEVTILCCNLTLFFTLLQHVWWYTCPNLLALLLQQDAGQKKLRGTKYCHTSTRSFIARCYCFIQHWTSPLLISLLQHQKFVKLV